MALRFPGSCQRSRAHNLQSDRQALIIADHTFVPDELRGRGLAQGAWRRSWWQIHAPEGSQRIVPLCPFLRSYAEKNREELADVIQW